ncbi:MAG TPA: DUF3237 domain-containing protein [Dehalococcoidia bacterium]|nr:DUF3237 domain-containing protein [Dehalococcoidia bacterium]
MPESSLPVAHLFTLRASLGAPDVIENGPQGSRVIVPVTGGSFEGERLSGEVLLPAGDWFTSRPDGSGKLDVRLTLKTNDGAAILMSYTGVLRNDGNVRYLRAAPLFETGDERYSWLNSIQAVSVGFDPEPGVIRYEIYELL